MVLPAERGKMDMLRSHAKMGLKNAYLSRNKSVEKLIFISFNIS